MPTISSFYGIMIRMFFDEHAPPHFHAYYGEYKAIFDIRRLELMEGKLPRRAMELTLDWAELHQPPSCWKTGRCASAICNRRK